MYKVLIVEDEVTILEGLQLIVDWGKYGFKIIGLCENGEKAVDVCRQDTPDVIITDIRMPGLSGLDLINKLGGRDSGIKYVILSGYDDFMYAQKAIEYGVESYILKPIDEKELINLLIDLKIKLDNEKDKVLEQQVLKERLNCVSNISSKSLLNKLFTKGYDYMNDVEKKILSEIFTGPFFLTLIKIDKYFKESNIYGFKNDESLKDVEDIISRCIGENYFPLDIGFYVWVGSSVNKNKIVNIFPKMLADVKQHTSNTVSVYTSKSFSDFEDAKAVFERAKAGFSKLYFTGEIGKCYDYFMDNSGGKNNYRELTDCVSNIISYFQMPDVRELEEHLNKLGYLCKQSTSSETEIKNLFVKIFSQVFIILTNNYKIEPNLVLSIIDRSIISSIENIDELIEWSKNVFDRIFEEVLFLGSKNNTFDVVENIKFFLNKNYWNPDITLYKVADNFFMNKDYLSHLFKSKEGISFSQYLCKVRIEKAKELLKISNIKIYEVAHKVGFNNEKYFSRMFKKFTKMSPKEFMSEVL